MKHELSVFRGCVPMVDPTRLPEDIPHRAVNYTVDNGTAVPLPKPKFSATLAKAGPILSLYRYRHPTGDKWLHWHEHVSVAPSPLSDDADNSVYYLEPGLGLAETAVDLVTDGQSPEQNKRYPVNHRRIYLPQPTEAIVASGGDEDGLKRIYTYTFVAGYVENNGVVTNAGFESAPAPASNPVFFKQLLDVDEERQPIALSIPTSAPGGAVVSHKNVYRLEEDGQFHLIATVPLYLPTLNDADSTRTGRLLDTYDYTPPPNDMHSLLLLENGSLAAATDREVCVTPPFIVYAWPDSYRFKCDSKVTALAATKAGILVGTEGKPYAITGYDPENMQKSRLELLEPCLGPRSMADMGEYACYAGASGLVAVSPTEARVMTSKHLKKQQWKALGPETLFACCWDDKYLAFCPDASGEFSDVKGFIFDLNSGDLFFHTIEATACHRDEKTGDVFIANGQRVFEFAAGSDRMMAEIKTGKLNNPLRKMVAYRLDGDGTTELSVWTDNGRLTDRHIQPNSTYRLPMAHSQYWQYRLLTDQPVRRFVVATNTQELL